MLGILIVLSLLLFLIPFVPLRFTISYANQGIDDYFLLQMSILRIFKWRREVTLIKPHLERWGIVVKGEKEQDIPIAPKAKHEQNEINFNAIFGAVGGLFMRLKKYGLGATLLSLFLPGKYRQYITVVEELENEGIFKQFDWETRVGSEDAAFTAVGTGLLWGLIGQVTGFLQNRYEFSCRPVLSVIPTFGRSVLDTRLDCIFELRIGHIISAGLHEWRRRMIMEGKGE